MNHILGDVKGSTSLVRTRLLIKKHEGCRLKAYKDTQGYWTVGYGHLLGKFDGWAKYEITQDIAELMFESDFHTHVEEMNRALPWIAALDEVRRAVLYDMCFNLGIEPFDNDGFKDWPIFISQVKDGFYSEAAHNMRATLWAKQVKSRAEQLATMMETGKWLSP